jgi:protein SCO1/2
MPLARSVIWITFAAVLIASCAQAPEPLAGTDLGTDPAPDVTLLDGVSGAPLRLSSLKGSVVVLTFLYTKCPDTCPLTAEMFRQTQRELGSEADRVHFVAITVDPANDTPAAVQQFSRAHGLERNWHYLIGQREQVAPVLQSYGIGTIPDPSGLVGHSDAIFLIDARFRARVLLHSPELGAALTKDVRSLLREKA